MANAAQKIDPMLVQLSVPDFKEAVREVLREEVQKHSAEPETWVTLARVADLYDCSTQTILNLIHKEGAPARRLSARDWRINLDKFGAWLDERGRKLGSDK